MITTTIETVSPALAVEYLRRNAQNRKVTKKGVERIARAISEDRWLVTCQGIGFDVTGRLVDGQHRLHAIVEAGKPVDILVVRGLDPAVFEVLDNGRLRTAKDTLDVLGHEQSSAYGAVLKTLHAYAIACSRPGVSMFNCMTPARMENFEVAILSTEFDGAQQWIPFGKQIAQTCPAVGSISGAAAALYLGARLNPQATREFADAVISGANLAPNSPALMLRNRAPAKERNQSGEPAQVTTFLLVAKALRFWIDGVTTVRSLRINSFERALGHLDPVTTRAFQNNAPAKGKR